MKKILGLLLLLCIYSITAVQAQRQRIKLKNGSSIIGKVSSNQDKVTIKTLDGSEWVFTWAEVEEIGDPIRRFREKAGYLNMTSFSLHMGSYRTRWDDKVVTAAPSITTFNGYQWKNSMAIGISLGVEGYPEMPVLPIALGFRGELFESTWTMLYGADVGYGFPWSKDDGCIEYTGGMRFNPMIGVKRYGLRGGGFFLQAGWHVQKMSSQSLGCWTGGINQTRKWRYQRLMMSIGIFF